MIDTQWTIGLVVWNMHGGGTQRVTSQLSLILKKYGLRVIVFTFHPPVENEFLHACDARKQFWFTTATDEQINQVIHEYKLDCVIFNDGWNEANFNHVVRVLKEKGVKTVCVNHHSPTNWLIALNNDGDFDRDEIRADIDLFVAVSPVQAIGWHIRGYKTVCLQNPIGIEVPQSNPYKHSHQLLWIGRNDPFKRLPLMLVCFERILNQIQDTILLIAGGFTDKEINQALRDIKPAVRKHIKFVGYQPKIENLFSQIGLHVCTSALECTTPQIILESSNYGVPTIMFELPICIEAVPENGIIQIAEDSIENFSLEAIKILKDHDYAYELSRKAFRFGTALPLQKIYDSWGQIFIALMKNDQKSIEKNISAVLTQSNLICTIKEMYRGEKYFMQHYFPIIKIWKNWEGRWIKLKKYLLKYTVKTT